MIDIGSKEWYFACDECGICEQLDSRLRVADETRTELQFDHCSCDKIDAEFFMGGYCEDAFVEADTGKIKGKRKTGRAFRRRMHRKHIQKHHDRRRFVRVYGAPCLNWGYVNGEYVMIGNHVDHPQNSKAKVFYKRASNKKVRHHEGRLPKGNGYRRLFDYWWTLY